MAFGSIAHVIKNNISYSNGTSDDNSGSWVQSNNTWNGIITVTNADFISLDTTGVTRPRKADGNLPAINFLSLKVNSDLINAGVNVGLPFYGIAPEMGAFENTNPVTAMKQPPVVKVHNVRRITFFIVLGLLGLNVVVLLIWLYFRRKKISVKKNPDHS
jgi:hypothetical protein